jgi:hypothetical protein
MTLPEAYKSQVQHLQPSPKFQRQQSGQGYKAVPFPGYSVTTPTSSEDTENQEFYRQLQTLQEQLVQQLSTDLLIPLPPDSFHMTLADLIWDAAYRHANENPDFQGQLRDRITQSFDQYQTHSQAGSSLLWQVMGLVVMPRALGVCLIPKDEHSYEQIFQLRRSIYQNSALIALGIEQQYHFTAHITLGYFGNAVIDINRDDLSDTLSHINLNWLETSSPQLFVVHQAELRKFDDMTYYYRESDWPVLKF